LTHFWYPTDPAGAEDGSGATILLSNVKSPYGRAAANSTAFKNEPSPGCLSNHRHPIGLRLAGARLVGGRGSNCVSGCLGRAGSGGPVTFGAGCCAVGAGAGPSAASCPPTITVRPTDTDPPSPVELAPADPVGGGSWYSPPSAQAKLQVASTITAVSVQTKGNALTVIRRTRRPLVFYPH